MWAEGAMGYQFMALEALVMDAEVLWHHGIDMYRYHNCALKRLFDTPLQFCYPDLTTPATHDSGRDSIVGGDSYVYEYAYRRYRDPSYLLILNQTGRHLDAHFQQFPVSVLYDRDPKEKQPAGRMQERELLRRRLRHSAANRPRRASPACCWNTGRTDRTATPTSCASISMPSTTS